MNACIKAISIGFSTLCLCAQGSQFRPFWFNEEGQSPKKLELPKNSSLSKYTPVDNYEFTVKEVESKFDAIAKGKKPRGILFYLRDATASFIKDDLQNDNLTQEEKQRGLELVEKAQHILVKAEEMYLMVERPKNVTLEESRNASLFDRYYSILVNFQILVRQVYIGTCPRLALPAVKFWREDLSAIIEDLPQNEERQKLEELLKKFEKLQEYADSI